jgi:hypothetical protein
VTGSVIRPFRWLAVLTAAAYVLTVAANAPGLIDALYWDTDVSAPFVLAERLRGHGSVFIPHYGSWTVLWWLLATRHLPGHRELWEATGYPFAVAAAALLGWATARVAGRWAGLTAAATALVVGPFALRSLLTVIFHVLPPFTAAVLGAYLVTLRRRRSVAAGATVAVFVGLLAGANAASDALLWVAGIAPFAIASAVFYASTRRRDVAVQAAVTLAVAVASALVTNVLMHGLGYKVVGLELKRAQLGDLAGNMRHLGRMVALLGGANYALPGGYPREPLRIVIALLAVLGVAAAIVAGVRSIARREEPVARAYACYWATSALLLGLSFIATTNAVALGAGSVNYLLPLALASGAGVGLLAAGSIRGQLIAAAGVAFVGVVNISGIAQGHAGTPKGAIGTAEPQLVRLLEKEGVTRGYAGYWDAQNLTWQSSMRDLVAPVANCGDGLCAFNFSTIRSWYDPHRRSSFLILDPTTSFLTETPAVTHDAAASYRLGPLRIYLFNYDLARIIRPPTAG